MIDSKIKLINFITENQIEKPSFDEFVNITTCLLDAIEIKYNISREESKIKLGIYCSLINDMVSQNADKDKK